jgi:hypothetical protein
VKKQDKKPIDKKSIAIIVLAVLLVAMSSIFARMVVSNSISKMISTYIRGADGLDYSDEANWYQLPASPKPGALNVFVVYPTVTADSSKYPYILNQNDPEMISGIDEFMLKSIQPVFDGLNVNIYVPKYRQFNGSYYSGNSYMQAVSEISGLPRTDIYNAFDYFLRNYNDNGNYMLIGHSQGAALVSFLVSDFAMRFASEATLNKMLLAVIAGWGLVKTTLQDSPYKFSRSPSDKNVILSWNTATAKEVHGNYDRFTWGDETTVSSNPTTFTDKPSTKARVVRPSSLGGTFPGEVLLINLPDFDYTTDEINRVMDNVNLGYAHVYDISLFVDEIRSNLKARLGI